MTAAEERARIAEWLDARARLLDDERCLELHFIAAGLRRNDMRPGGLLANETIVNGYRWRAGVNLAEWLARGAETP